MPDVTTSRLELKSMKAQMPIRDLVRFFLPMVRPFWKELSLAFVAMALGAGISVFRPWPLKVVIDLVISHKHCRVPLIGPWLDHAPLTKMQVLYGACAATIVISLLSGALTYSVTRSLGAAAQRFVFTLRRNLFAHMQRLSLQFHDRQRTGDLITRLTSDIQALRDVLGHGSILLVGNGALLAGMIAMMVWLNWQFALAALSVAPLLFWTVFRYTHRIKAAARDARASDGLLASVAQETLASIRIVQG